MMGMNELEWGLDHKCWWETDVHVALLNVGGQVSKEDKYFNPPAIAEKFWELYEQEKGKWTLDLDLLGGGPE